MKKVRFVIQATNAATALSVITKGLYTSFAQYYLTYTFAIFRDVFGMVLVDQPLKCTTHECPVSHLAAPDESCSTDEDCCQGTTVIHYKIYQLC